MVDERKIKREIAQLRAKIEPLRERIAYLDSCLESPYVIPVLHYVCYGSKEEEELDYEPYTLEHAFEVLRSGEDYGNWSGTGVSVGGCLVTDEEWYLDPRRPGSEKVIAERQAKLDQERARRVEIALALDTTVAVFAGEERVSPAMAFGHGIAHINADFEGNVYGLRLRSENGSVMAVNLHWEQVGPDRWAARWYPELG